MSETATRLPRARTTQPKKPVWAEVLDTFYANSFDASSSEALTDCADAFAELSDTDRAFHQAHLTYRQTQALGDIYGCLRRIEAGLPDPKAVTALQHLPGIRKALVVIAKGQEEMLELLEAGGGQGVSGDREEEDDDEDEEQSDLSDAVDLDEVEEEDHGNGDGEVIVPEVLPAGTHRAAAGGAP
ncbi:MAG: hypothetical protein V4850_01400 [Myxococcota bacterium]